MSQHENIQMNLYCVLFVHFQLLRESIAEHKPHIDKLLKIGPQLAQLSLQEGEAVTQRFNNAERRYLAIKEEVKGRAASLDEAVSQSAQVRLQKQTVICLCPTNLPQDHGRK